jgi:hypothetical protein
MGDADGAAVPDVTPPDFGPPITPQVEISPHPGLPSVLERMGLQMPEGSDWGAQASPGGVDLPPTFRPEEPPRRPEPPRKKR